MKNKFFLGVALFSIIAVLSAAVPNRSAVVTAMSTSTCGCGGTAETHVSGSFSNAALTSMGISSISMTGPVSQNTDLAAAPPHLGYGGGRATVTQTGTCTVTTDSSGTPSVFPSYTTTYSTTSCVEGE